MHSGSLTIQNSKNSPVTLTLWWLAIVPLLSWQFWKEKSKCWCSPNSVWQKYLTYFLWLFLKKTYYEVWQTKKISRISKQLLQRVTKNYYKVWQILQVIQNILQSVTGITKCDKSLLQSVAGVTSDTGYITKCGKYYKVWQKVITKCGRSYKWYRIYYKVWQVLQSVTKGYYKVWQELQNAIIITKIDATGCY